MATYILPDLRYDYGALEPHVSGRIMELHHDKHHAGYVTLMVLDAWEHAYYLQYENRKADFFQAAWHVWNWTDVGQRFETAKRVSITLNDASR